MSAVLPDGEELRRALTSPLWWIGQERRVSSAAFAFPVFSVDVASWAGPIDATLGRFRPGTGLCTVTAGDVRATGADPRPEVDLSHPDNLAHANVYMPHGNRRKSAARRIADGAVLVVAPSAAPEHDP